MPDSSHKALPVKHFMLLFKMMNVLAEKQVPSGFNQTEFAAIVAHPAFHQSAFHQCVVSGLQAEFLCLDVVGLVINVIQYNIHFHNLSFICTHRPSVQSHLESQTDMSLCAALPEISKEGIHSP